MTGTPEERSKRVLPNWQMHQTIKSDSFKQMEHIILLIGVGSFGVSIPFLSSLKGGVSGYDWIWLVTSWICLLSAVLYLFLSLESSVQVSLRNQFLLNQFIIHGPISQSDGVIDENMDTNKDPQVIQHTDKYHQRIYAAKAFLIAGIAFLIMFAIASFIHNQGAKKDSESSIGIFVSQNCHRHL